MIVDRLKADFSFQNLSSTNEISQNLKSYVKVGGSLGVGLVGNYSKFLL